MGLLTTLFGVMAVATVGAAAAFIVNRSNFAGKNPLHPLKVQAL